MTKTRTRDPNKNLKRLLDYLKQERGFDFTGYHAAMVERRISRRLSITKCSNHEEYLDCLHRTPDELDHMLDVLTINVSRFFRDSLTFELLADRILPAIAAEKVRTGDRSLRIWSSGCANGEEPYSVAILIRELMQKEGIALNPHIFATDIDQPALIAAQEAVYPPAGLEDMKMRLLNRYFTADGSSYRIIPEIKALVNFSRYDMLDAKHRVPPESVYGNFDIVLCRNLLIYFTTDYQDKIFARLHAALAPGGHLILGEAEMPTVHYQHHFTKAFDVAQIYRKQEEI